MGKSRGKGSNIFFSTPIQRRVERLMSKLKTICLLILVILALFQSLETYSQDSSNIVESLQLITMPPSKKSPSEARLDALRIAIRSAFVEHFGLKYPGKIKEKFDEVLSLLSETPENYIRGYQIIAEKNTEQASVILLKISISSTILEDMQKRLDFGPTTGGVQTDEKKQRVLVLVAHVTKGGFGFWWGHSGEMALTDQEQILSKALSSLGYEGVLRLKPENITDEMRRPFLEDEELNSLLGFARAELGFYITWSEVDGDDVRVDIRTYSVSKGLSQPYTIIYKKGTEKSELLEYLILKLKQALYCYNPQYLTKSNDVYIRIKHYENAIQVNQLLDFMRQKKLILSEPLPYEIAFDYAIYRLKLPYTSQELFKLMKIINDWPTDLNIQIGENDVIDIEIKGGG